MNRIYKIIGTTVVVVSAAMLAGCGPMYLGDGSDSSGGSYDWGSGWNDPGYSSTPTYVNNNYYPRRHWRHWHHHHRYYPQGHGHYVPVPPPQPSGQGGGHFVPVSPPHSGQGGGHFVPVPPPHSGQGGGHFVPTPPPSILSHIKKNGGDQVGFKL